MLSSYPKIYHLGHPQIRDLFNGPVVVQEKVDGSQFSFGVLNGKLHCRSKGVDLNLEEPEKMFSKAVEYVESIQHKLVPGYTYCCEYLNRPQHNTLSYDRAPLNNLALYDVMRGPEDYCETPEVRAAARDLEVDLVPVYYEGDLADGFNEFINLWMNQTSFLGGAKVEGVVIKNHRQFAKDGKPMMAKVVSEEFKELHQGEWKKNNPAPADVRAALALKFCTPARWQKAVQHLAERGELQNDPKDIGPLMREVHLDIDAECQEEIAQALLKWAMPEIKRQAARGLPEWYKEKLGMK